MDKSTLPVFYINLDSSKERRKNTQVSLDKKFSNIERIEAIDGKKIIDRREGSISNVRYLIKSEKVHRSKNVLGCLLSHLKIFDIILEKNLDMAIICEDDIDLKYFEEVNIENIIKNKPKDCKLLKIATNDAKMSSKLIDLYNKGIEYYHEEKTYLNCSTAFYIITKEYIQEFKNKYYKDKTWLISGGNINADYFLWLVDGVYNYTKPIVCFKALKSDIGNCVNSFDVKTNSVIKNYYGY